MKDNHDEEIPADVSVQPPAGYKRADTDVDDYPAWDFETGTLNGTVAKLKTVELIRRGEPVDVRLAIVDEVGGKKWALWESANLGNFFDNIRPGSEIQVSYRGTAQLSGAREMNLYDAFYRE